MPYGAEFFAVKPWHRSKAVANEKKDELDNALGDLNRSTNRLRRAFDPTDKWLETWPQVERVMDDARKINQDLVRGTYGAGRMLLEPRF